MEDEPDKLRRNTVVLSSLVVIFGYLKLKFPAEILGFGIPINSEGKIWILMLIVGIYCLLRYHFCPDAVALRKAFFAEMRTLPGNKRHYMIGVAARFRRLFFALPGAYNDASAFLSGEKNQDQEFFDLNRVKGLRAYPSHDWGIENGVEKLDISFGYIESTGAVQSYNFKTGLNLTTCTVLVAGALAGITLLSSPKNIVDLFVPYVMFCCAFFAMAHRVVTYL